jgi:hypothetical protein
LLPVDDLFENISEVEVERGVAPEKESPAADVPAEKEEEESSQKSSESHE